MRASPCLLAIAGALVAACGNPPPPSALIDGGPRDAQPRDSGLGGDGGGALEDGGPPEDGGGLLDGGGGIDPMACRADPATDIFTLATDMPARNRDVGVAAGATNVAIAWSARIDGFENVWMAEIPSGEGLVAAQQLTTATATLRDPVLLPNGTDWILAWYGNAAGDFDPYSQAWAAGRAVGPAQRLSMRAGRDDGLALLGTPTGALVAWVETRMDVSRVAVMRPLSTTAMPTAPQRDASAASAALSRPILAARAGGVSLAYVDSAGATPSVFLQALDPSGTPSGAPIPISTEGNADGTLDLASNESGGAVVFGTLVAGARPEVRAILIDGSGQPSSSERVISMAPSTGRDASIARYAGGYLIAYRRLDGTTPMLHLAFVANDLDVIGGVDIAEVAPTGGRVTIRVSGEGRIIVGWADSDATSTVIRAARVRCD